MCAVLIILQASSSLENDCDVEVWEFESESESDPQAFKSAPQTACETSQLNDSPVFTLVGFICTFLFAWQAMFRIPDGALNILFKFFSLLLNKLVPLLYFPEYKSHF